MKKVVLAVDPMDYEIRGLYRFASLKPECTIAADVEGVWPENPRMLMVASDPDDTAFVENLGMDFASSLTKAEVPVGELRILERETEGVAKPLLEGADVIVLADGDDVKRKEFFAAIDFPELLKGAKEDAVLIALDKQALATAGVSL